jgi:hypothetical protein
MATYRVLLLQEIEQIEIEAENDDEAKEKVSDWGEKKGHVFSRDDRCLHVEIENLDHDSEIIDLYW